MHTYISEDGTRFHYNSDFSGDAIIVPKFATEEDEARIPATDLLEFVVANYVIPQGQSDLERVISGEFRRLQQGLRSN